MAFWDRLKNTFGGGRKADEIREELEFHVEERTRQNVARGMTPDEARREARLRFGGAEKMREATREADVFSSLEAWLRDARFAARGLARRPGLVATAIASLGVGIAAVTLIFSVFDAMLLRPFPMANPDTLVVIEERRNGQRHGGNPARLREYREQLTAVSSITGVYGEGMVLTGRGDARRLTAIRFFGDALGLLGVTPQAGRLFSAEESQARTALPAMLTDAGWRKHFNGDPSIIGQALALDKQSYTVIGILPAAFNYPDDADLWVPAAADFQNATGRRSAWFQVVARLAKTTAELDAQLATVTGRMAAAHPATDAGLTARAVPLQEFETAGARGPAYLIMGAVSFVLLIACLNITTLLLARAAERQRESAIRLAMGAGSGALARLALMESLGLALAGGLVGAALAGMSLEAFKQLLPADTPRLSAVALDGRVLTFALAVSLFCGFLCGLRPAFESARLRLAEFLQSGGRTAGSRRRQRSRALLVVTQVAFSCVLLTGAALLLQGLVSLLRRPVGVKTENVLSVQVPLSWEMPLPQVLAFHDRALPALAALPGVRSVGLADRLPAHGNTQTGPVDVRGRDTDPRVSSREIGWRAVDPGYFPTLRIPLLRGKLFQPPRDEKSPHQAVISQSLARRLFPGQDPVGQYVSQSAKDGKWFEVTGVVADVRRQISHREGSEDVYVSHRDLFWAMPAYVIATDGDPTRLIPAVRTAFRQVDPNLPLGEILPLDTAVERQTRDPLVLTSLMGGFALAALVLAAIGLYGLLARDVAERTQEIGVRLALGADPGDVLRLTLQRGAWLAGSGLLLGAALGAPFARLLLTELPPGTAELQWSTMAAAGAGLLTIALAASYWPARRAARVDPLVALRHD